ncbi:hypothetical protein K525DRAFT_193663 [Schizophyllum commune Loenen D]|nr:hypothetical protein K525DRAFT_193663 [Schizophyllum commune Loenen D]
MPSTPLRRGAHGYALRKLEVMDPVVRKEVHGRVCRRDIPLVAFVKNVYGLDDDTVDKILNTNFTFPAAPLKEYMSIIDQHQYEPAMYKPFKEIFDAFVKTVCTSLGIDFDEEELLEFYEKQGRHVIDGVKGSERKPDAITADPEVISDPTRIVWQLVFHYFEFKKRKYYTKNSKGQVHELGSVKETTSSHKRHHITSVICQELQAAHYALECMDAETSRRYVTGVCIDDYKVWLMYHNRSHVFRTTHFNFVESPHLLALIAYALVRCKPVQAGFDPLLQFPSEGKDGAVSYSNDVTYPRTLAGARFVFPEGQGQPASTFCIQSPATLSRYQGLLGRGTMVHPVKELGDDRTAYVVKIGYTSPGRELEPVILKRLLKTLPDMQNHFPVVKAWRAFEPLELCGLLALIDEATRDALVKDSRTMVYQVTLRLRPLWELDSVQEFEECYVDIVEMHYHAYKYARTLHRDISENNAMSRVVDNGVVGFLNDWDLACFVNEHGISEAATQQHRTGTGPFMAIDLQFVTVDGKVLPLYYRYCHDLESLFWLLLWAVIHFDITKKRRLPCRAPQWGEDAWADVANFKHCVLTAANTRQGVLDLALPIYEDLVERWVMPLALMFKKARSDAEDINEKKKCFFNTELYAQEATFEKFMETIQRKPRTWSHQEKAE